VELSFEFGCENSFDLPKKNKPRDSKGSKKTSRALKNFKKNKPSEYGGGVAKTKQAKTTSCLREKENRNNGVYVKDCFDPR
jgi:hypothetical protein